MSISKEIFGIDKIDIDFYEGSEFQYRYEEGFNSALLLIDQYEISEEAIANAIYHVDTSDYKNCLQIAKFIKRNQLKIFVRKHEI